VREQLEEQSGVVGVEVLRWNLADAPGALEVETTARKRGSATMASAGMRGFDPPPSVET
jgi:hypothetical protein